MELRALLFLCITTASISTCSSVRGFPYTVTRNRRAAPSNSDLKVPAQYNINALPPSDIPQQVQLSILVVSIDDIKEVAEQISIEMNFRIQWKDERLAPLVASLVNSSLATKPNAKEEDEKPEFYLLEPSMLQKIWVPDVYFDHLKGNQQPAVLQKPASLRLYEDSSVRYSARVTISVSCPMSFESYPADTQRCDVDLKSYGYTEEKMVLKWRENFGANFMNPVDVQNFYIALDNPNAFQSVTLSGRIYSGLRFTIILTRKLSYHIIQTYLPSILLVVVSFLSFWISLDAVPARTALLMTCLLTLISMFSAVRQSTPNVSYVKAIDIWMVTCVFFVFLALLEFVVALKLKAMKQKGNGRKSKKGKAKFPAETHEGIPLNVRFGGHAEKQIEEVAPPQKPSTLASEEFNGQLEFLSSIILPALFVLFNLIYWPWLIISSEYSTQQGVLSGL